MVGVVVDMAQYYFASLEVAPVAALFRRNDNTLVPGVRRPTSDRTVLRPSAGLLEEVELLELFLYGRQESAGDQTIYDAVVVGEHEVHDRTDGDHVVHD